MTSLVATDVIDLGCHPHGTQVSVGPLLRRFRPKRFYGFDPYPSTREQSFVTHPNGGTMVTIRRQAAWTYDGIVRLNVAETGSTLIVERGVQGVELEVDCFDLAVFLQNIADDEKKDARSIVVKFNVEGAEYDLLTHLHATGTDELVKLALVEWHDVPFGEDWKADLLGRLRCEVQPWQ